jgi:hypothetical protein
MYEVFLGIEGLALYHLSRLSDKTQLEHYLEEAQNNPRVYFILVLRIEGNNRTWDRAYLTQEINND